MTVPRRPPRADRHPRRAVLLVEDEPFVREATYRILRVAGFDVLAAANAQEAMKLYDESERRIDLLMTDVIMPGRSGRELAQELRRTSPSIPILLTSGYIEQDESESEQARTYYLQKPYSRAELIGKMEKILNGVPRHRAASQAG